MQVSKQHAGLVLVLATSNHRFMFPFVALVLSSLPPLSPPPSPPPSPPYPPFPTGLGIQLGQVHRDRGEGEVGAREAGPPQLPEPGQRGGRCTQGQRGRHLTAPREQRGARVFGGFGTIGGLGQFRVLCGKVGW